MAPPGEKHGRHRVRQLNRPSAADIIDARVVYAGELLLATAASKASGPISATYASGSLQRLSVTMSAMTAPRTRAFHRHEQRTRRNFVKSDPHPERRHQWGFQGERLGDARLRWRMARAKDKRSEAHSYLQKTEDTAKITRSTGPIGAQIALAKGMLTTLPRKLDMPAAATIDTCL